MKSNEFNFTGTYAGKKYTAAASAFKEGNYPQVFVSVNNGKPQNTNFTFYFINEKKRPFLIYYLLLTTHYSPLTTHHLPLTTHYL